MKPDVRCPVCEHQYNLAGMRRLGAKDCPQCHTKLEPHQLSQDGYIRLNWEEIRMLAIFAKRWGARFNLEKRGNKDSLSALENTCRKLQIFQPTNARPLLGDKPPETHEPEVLVESQTSKNNTLKDGSVLSPWQPRRK